MQIAMYYACPFGERRQDLRAAYNTANLMAAQMPENSRFSDAEFAELVNGLSRYLKCDQQKENDEETADMDALAIMQQGMKDDAGAR